MATAEGAHAYSASGGNYDSSRRRSGSLYAVHGYPGQRRLRALENATDLGAAPNLNTVGSRDDRGLLRPVHR